MRSALWRPLAPSLRVTWSDLSDCVQCCRAAAATGQGTERKATTARRFQNFLLLVAPEFRLTKVEEQIPNPTTPALRLRPSTLLLHGADCLAPQSCLHIGMFI